MRPPWFLVVDEHRVRLLVANATTRERPHVAQHGSHEVEPGATSVAQIARWIEFELRRRNIECVTLFAPESILVALRRLWSPVIRARLIERLGRYARLDEARLAGLCAIASLAAEDAPA